MAPKQPVAAWQLITISFAGTFKIVLCAGTFPPYGRSSSFVVSALPTSECSTFVFVTGVVTVLPLTLAFFVDLTFTVFVWKR